MSSDLDPSLRRLSDLLNKQAQAKTEAHGTMIRQEAERTAERVATAAQTAAEATAAAALAGHTGRTDNPHAVTAEQVGAVPTGRTLTINGTTQDLSEDRSWTVGGMTNPMTTPNDLIIGGTAGAPARLGKGAAGQILTVDPSTLNLVWRTPTLADIGAVGTSDSRLSDARTPTAHKATHATGGTDALSPADIGAAATSHAHAAGDITSGILATARGGTGWATQPAFFVYRDSPQSGITNTTHHKVLWTHELYDTAGLFDLANSRCTLKTGKWQFIISIVFTSTAVVAGRYLVVRVYKNGLLFFSPVGFVAQASVTTYPGFAVPVSIDAVNDTDYYEIYVYHNNGNTLSLDGNASYATHWSAIQQGA